MIEAKAINEGMLERLKKDGEEEHYILARAQVGGNVGQHWVVIEDYGIETYETGDGEEEGERIKYTAVASSENDEGRNFYSVFGKIKEGEGEEDFSAYAVIDKLEVYSIKREKK